MEKVNKTEYRFTKDEIKRALIGHFAIEIAKNADLVLELVDGKEWKYHGYLSVVQK